VIDCVSLKISNLTLPTTPSVSELNCTPTQQHQPTPASTVGWIGRETILEKGITKRAHVEHRKGDADRLLGMLHTCEHDKTPSLRITAIIGGEVWRRAEDALRCRAQLPGQFSPLPCSETARIVVGPWRGVNRRAAADRTLPPHAGTTRREHMESGVIFFTRFRGPGPPASSESSTAGGSWPPPGS